MGTNDVKYNDSLNKQADEAISKLTSKIEGKVTKTKKPMRKKFADIFITDDIANVKEYIFYEIVVPTMKNTIVNVITRSAEMIFLGKISNRSSSNQPKPSSSSSYFAYDSISKYDPRSISASRYGSQNNRRYSFDEIHFELERDARQVLNDMREIFDHNNNRISVYDFYHLCKLDSMAEYTDQNYGWRSLNGAYVSSDAEGYFIALPRVVDIRDDLRR